MKKFGVIHNSDNWVYGPSIEKFDSLPEAEKYVKNFRGGLAHKKDSARIIEFISEHKATIVDQSENSILYGLKEEK